MASGDMLGWNAMIHKSGAKRAKGGSGALTQAMAKCLLSHGGEIICDAEVTEINQGKPWKISYQKSASVVAAAVPSGGQSSSKKAPPLGTAAATTELTATRVVSAIHLHTLFKMLPDAPEEMTKRVARTRIGNGFGMIVRHAVEELPDYGDAPPGPLPGTKRNSIGKSGSGGRRRRRTRWCSWWRRVRSVFRPGFSRRWGRRRFARSRADRWNRTRWGSWRRFF